MQIKAPLTNLVGERIECMPKVKLLAAEKESNHYNFWTIILNPTVLLCEG